MVLINRSIIWKACFNESIYCFYNIGRIEIYMQFFCLFLLRTIRRSYFVLQLLSRLKRRWLFWWCGHCDKDRLKTFLTLIFFPEIKFSLGNFIESGCISARLRRGFKGVTSAVPPVSVVLAQYLSESQACMGGTLLAFIQVSALWARK